MASWRPLTWPTSVLHFLYHAFCTVLVCTFLPPTRSKGHDRVPYEFMASWRQRLATCLGLPEEADAKAMVSAPALAPGAPAVVASERPMVLFINRDQKHGRWVGVVGAGGAGVAPPHGWG